MRSIPALLALLVLADTAHAVPAWVKQCALAQRNGGQCETVNPVTLYDGSTEYSIDANRDGTADFTFNSSGFSTPRVASPSICFGDSDAGGGDDNTCIITDCITETDGSEDCDISIAQQIDGVLSTVWKADSALPDSAYVNFGPGDNSTFITPPATGNCHCYVGSMPVAFTEIDDVSVRINNFADANETDDVMEFAIYSPDGQTQFFEAAIDIDGTPSSSLRHLANSITMPSVLPASKFVWCYSYYDGGTAPTTLPARLASADNPLNGAVRKSVTCTNGLVPTTVDTSGMSVVQASWPGFSMANAP